MDELWPLVVVCQTLVLLWLLYSRRRPNAPAQPESNAENVLSLIYNSSNELMGLVKVEAEGSYTLASLNQAYIKLLREYGLNFQLQEFLGLSLDDFCRQVLHNSEEAIAHVKARYGEVLQTKAMVQYETSSQLKGGQMVVLEIVLSPVLDAQGNCTHIVDVTRDITARKMAEESLKKANKMLSTLISNLPGVVYRCKGDALWTVEFLSAGFQEMTGHAPDKFYEERTGPHWKKLQHKEDAQEAWKAMQEACKNREPYRVLYRIYPTKSKERWIWEQGREVYGENGEVLWREGFMLDITDLKKAQARLVSALKDRQRFIRQHNKMLELKVIERTNELLEKSEELQKANLRLQEQANALNQSNQQLETARQELDKQNQGMQHAMRRLKDTQTQLVQKEKMATLGQLTAGIAHEINNPVNYIHSGTEGLRIAIDDLITIFSIYERLEQGGDIKQIMQEVAQAKADLGYEELMQGIYELLDNISQGAMRTAEIVRELRSFSRLDEASLKKVDLHENIDSTLVMLRSQYKNRIDIVKLYGKLPIVECFPGKLNQVFMNLLVNAIQAIEGKGQIFIRTACSSMREDGRCAEVSVSITDTGKGIPDAIRDKIFEPFFTNKEVGDGTGLGLSISMSIIESHRGRIVFESKEGEGSTFTIFIPTEQLFRQANA